VLCFTSRSGSHFLGQALASDGRLLRPGETLNADVLRHAKEQRLRSFEGYLAWLLAAPVDVWASPVSRPAWVS
jgi:hypothetical protein